MQGRKNIRITSKIASMAVLVVLVFGDGLAGSVSAVLAGDRPRSTVELIGMSTIERDEILHAIELFAEAGLELPPVRIERHDDNALCNGNDGLHHLVGAWSQIDICVGGSSEARVILHELTHAWAFHSLTPERKEAFKQLRGWQYWLDYTQAEWEDNGAEQAAEIMVWALSDHPVPVVKIDHQTCAELRAGYITLTGLEPLHGYTDLCNDRPLVRRS